MKKALILLILVPVFAFAQTIEDLDFIAPFNDGFAAVKKDNSWGFINEKGNLAIAFRDDLVLTETNGTKHPVFYNNRCLISESKNGITYFGYIDKTGKTVIEPQFLNASNFKGNHALALNVLEQTLGENELLNKKVVNYKYFEVVINSNGEVKEYLNPKGVNVVLDRDYIKSPPKINSKLISENLIAFFNNKKWTVKPIK